MGTELITLSDILDYVGSFTRPMREGLRIANSNHISKFGICQDEENTISVTGFCLTSSVSAQPHELSITKDLRTQKVRAACTCKAGKSKCKHVVALMLKLEKLPSSEIPRLSKTDIQRKWGKVSQQCIESYDACRIEELCHVDEEKIPYNKPLPDSLSPAMKTFVFRNVLEAFPLSACALNAATTCQDNAAENATEMEICEVIEQDFILKIVTSSSPSFPPADVGFMDLCTCTQSAINLFYEKVSVSRERAVQIAFDTIDQQGSSVWFFERKLRITASIAYSLYTAYIGKKCTDWDTKIGSIVSCKFSGNKATAHGKNNEDRALQAFTISTGCKVLKAGLIINEILPWFGFSPDGFITCDNGDLILLEVKCPFRGATESMEEMLETFRYLKYNANNVPYLKKKNIYYGQVQFALALSGLKLAKLLVYCAKDNINLVVDVPFDLVFATQMLGVLNTVYFQYFLPYLAEHFENTDESS